MHYIVGQSVLGDSNRIHVIKKNKKSKSIEIFIINEKKEIVLWKEFTFTVPISIESNINF